MLLVIAAATFLGLLALVVFPALGASIILLVRPLVDTSYSQKLVGDYALTELLGVGFPVAVLLLGVLRGRGARGFTAAPLWPLWLLYGVDVLLFASILAGNEGLEAGANIFFRQINMVAGYYFGQAFFQGERGRRWLFRVLLIATLFPLGVGLYQFVTGYQWTKADTEGITRYVGLYHDAFTVRYYMMQGILAAVMLLALPKQQRSMLGKLALWVLMACALLVMYRAYSKSAIATLAVWILLWCTLRRKFLQLAVAGAAAALAIGAYAPVIADQVGRMFHKEIGALGGHGDLSHTFAGRWYGWHDLMADWRQLDAASQFLGGHTAVGAHNDFLMMLMHGGIFGLTVYLVLLLSVGGRLGRNALKRADPLTVGGLMAFALWCIDSVGLVPSIYPGYQWFVWSIIGVSLRARADERHAAQTKADQVNPAARLQGSPAAGRALPMAAAR